jgi:hypothetical protein
MGSNEAMVVGRDERRSVGYEVDGSDMTKVDSG